MWLNVDGDVLGLDGKAIKDETGKVWTTKDTICNALLGPAQEVKAIDEKMRRFELALRIHAASGLPVKVSEDETTLIKKVCNERYESPLIVARICQAFTTEEKEKNGVDSDHISAQ